MRKTELPRARVIVNPAAGANATRKRWPDLQRLLTHIGLSFDHDYTEGTGHAIELAREAAGKGYSCIVAVGGDGTVNEVANGILLSDEAQSVSLGVISTGTGSDFVRSMDIPGNYLDACSCLTGSKRHLIDVGIVEYMRNGQSEKRFFMNAAGIGFDAAAVEATEQLPKYFGGTIPYLFGLLRTLVGYRNKSVEISIDDKAEMARVCSVVVSNGNYLGGGMRISPFASLNDGLLDVCVIGDIGKIDLLKSLPMVYKGTHGDHPKVTMDKAEKITVRSAEKVLVHADGDVVGTGPASFSLFPAALNIVVQE
ncbi:diacylglycerol/lipid kinase family protein [Chloroflexota bacterium]